MTAKKIALVGGGTVFAGLILWSIYTGPLGKRHGATSEARVSVESGIGTSSEDTKGDIKVVSPDIEYGFATSASATSEREATNTSYPALDRPIVIPASFSQEDAALIRGRIGELSDAILKNSSNGALWANLGMERKGLEDYTGAVEAYEYALKRMQNNAVIAENLGVLYGDYLRDLTKAEAYYRLSITLDGSAVHRYIRLFDLYRYALKDTKKAKAVLEEGLRTHPGDTSLQALLEGMD